MAPNKTDSDILFEGGGLTIDNDLACLCQSCVNISKRLLGTFAQRKHITVQLKISVSRLRVTQILITEFLKHGISGRRDVWR